MNKLILLLIILSFLILFGCNQTKPICGDGICSIGESSNSSPHYCSTDCGIDDSDFITHPNKKLSIPNSNDANFLTEKTNYEIGEQIIIQ